MDNTEKHDNSHVDVFVYLQREFRRGKLGQSCSRSQKGSVCSRPFEDPAKAVKELIHLESESEKLIHSQPGINKDQLVFYLGSRYCQRNRYSLGVTADSSLPGAATARIKCRIVRLEW